MSDEKTGSKSEEKSPKENTPVVGNPVEKKS